MCEEIEKIGRQTAFISKTGGHQQWKIPNGIDDTKQKRPTDPLRVKLAFSEYRYAKFLLC